MNRFHFALVVAPWIIGCGPAFTVADQPVDGQGAEAAVSGDEPSVEGVDAATSSDASRAEATSEVRPDAGILGSFEAGGSKDAASGRDASEDVRGAPLPEAATLPEASTPEIEAAAPEAGLPPTDAPACGSSMALPWYQANCVSVSMACCRSDGLCGCSPDGFNGPACK